MWDVEFTDEFESWWDTLTSEEQQAIDAVEVQPTSCQTRRASCCNGVGPLS